MSTGYVSNNKFSSYQTGDNKFEHFNIAEMRMLFAQYGDPLSLCFKFMPDFSKPYGLISDEKNVNSALAYLKRIGENDRYELLKKWIGIFKLFVKNYDFLILECTGLDEIASKQTHEFFTENDKISFKIRETIDMLCQSLITMYRAIAYCETRKVEVLPANLRKIDFGVLVFSQGYFNMSFYDVLENNGLTENDVETQMFPTLKKLSLDFFIDNANEYAFNHHFFSIGDAEINVAESGKSFFETMSNEISNDYVKNTLSFNFRFAQYKGMFNNLFGKFDFVKAMAIAASQDRVSNVLTNNISASTNAATNFVNKDNAKISELNKKLKSIANKAIGRNTAIGNALENLTSADFYVGMAKNTLQNFADELENKYINNPLTDLNNLVFQTFSDNFIDAYKNFKGKEVNNKIIVSDSKNTFDNPNNKIEVNENISPYFRKGF